MEPTISAPHPSPETGANNPQVLSPRPEAISHSSSDTAPERQPQQEQHTNPGVSQSSPALPVVAPLAKPAAMAAPLLSPLPADTSGPALAGDDELIEKEWVDKAKKVVSETRDDPYSQEKEVSKLQADYLKKRYGKEVKLASDA